MTAILHAFVCRVSPNIKELNGWSTYWLQETLS